MNRKQFLIAGIIIFLIGLFFVLELQQWFTLELIKQKQSLVQDWYHSHPIMFASLYFILYISITGLSLPGAAVMTVLGGAVFGFWVGTLLVSFASTLGATLAFLVARYLLRDWVQQRFSRALQRINTGIEREGLFFLFTVRLIPLFPFFVVNLVMALTAMRLWSFYWVSQAGMLAGTMVFVNAGTEIAKLDSLADVLSLSILFSFVLLALFPMLAKWLLSVVQRWRLYRNYPKPKQFQRNLIVIGAGAAGLVTSYIASAVKAKVTLIEQDQMGGDCLNTGCVPSKALIRSARISHYVNQAEGYGIKVAKSDVDFKLVMARVHEVIAKIAPHDSVSRYTDLGVECIKGKAKIQSPYEVVVNGQVLTARHIVIATGARPWVPPIEGLHQVPYFTSDTIWNINRKPDQLVVLGGGAIGCELAQAFARLGCEVTLIEVAERLLIRMDQAVAEILQQQLLIEGIKLLLATEVKRVAKVTNTNDLEIICHQCDVGEQTIHCDTLLVAVGRQANTKDLGLEELQIPLTERGTVMVNQYLQTRFPNILACGDVVGPYQLTHAAGHQAWYAAVNSLFNGVKKFKVDYSVMPAAVFTDPEIAHVGINEIEAQQQSIAYEITQYDLTELDRAIADGQEKGFIKVLTVPNRDKILGVTIVGYHAAELLGEFVLAMRWGLGLNKVLTTVHAYPTLLEANKYVAGEWKKAHVSPLILKILSRYHKWRRFRGMSLIKN